jgi:hypothetical protein
MQLVVFQLISGVVSDVIRHVYDAMKKTWLERESNKEDELVLSPVAIEDPGQRKGN